MDQNSAGYLKRLFELLQNLEVTDRKGVLFSLDEVGTQVVAWIDSLRLASGKVMAIGNGGSASIASHMQNDLSKGVDVRAMVFYEAPLLTAISNDLSFQEVFERPIGQWAQPGDILFAISSSGQSENILRGVRAALAKGCQVVTLSGFKPDNPLRRMGHFNLYVPAQIYGHVEAAHSVLSHFLTDETLARYRLGIESVFEKAAVEIPLK